MRKIAITQRLIEHTDYHEVRECLDIKYCELLKMCGFLPIVLPYKVDFKQYFKEFDIDGVLLSGGNNLVECDTCSTLSKIRDEYEINIIKYCIANNIAILGICRGAQVLAKYFGANFIKVENQINIKHKLELNTNSKYKSLKSIKQVNSFHNYAISNPSEELVISASYNGIIKAIEHKRYRIFGQMWHTERDIADTKQKDFIKEFFNYDIKKLQKILKKAGDKILQIYNTNFDISYKNDKSPLTAADIISHNFILKELGQISNYPIISEEGRNIKNKNIDMFWLLDPLDGTKDFIAKNGEWTINLALIKNNTPILGIIYIPVYKEMYWAIKNMGAYKNNKKIFNNKQGELIATDSNFHSTSTNIEFCRKNNIRNIKRYGSAIKFCRLAEGNIDIYPRFNGSKLWDIAAGHIILKESGCKILDVSTNKEPTYNIRILENNHFVAYKKGVNFIL